MSLARPATAPLVALDTYILARHLKGDDAQQTATAHSFDEYLSRCV